MFKKFAMHIIDDVSLVCENKMNSYKTSDKKADVLNKVSKELTEALCEMSSDLDNASK